MDDVSDPEQFENLKMNIPLGTAPTPMHRVIFFTNDMQHKVRIVSNIVLVLPSITVPFQVEPLYIETGSNEVGRRKILCFFLVDPDHRY